MCLTSGPTTHFMSDYLSHCSHMQSDDYEMVSIMVGSAASETGIKWQIPRVPTRWDYSVGHNTNARQRTLPNLQPSRRLQPGGVHGEVPHVPRLRTRWC